MNDLLDPLFRFFAAVLSSIYSVIPSYGLAITIFTVLMMAAITPLTVKSTKSMLQTQRLQPRLKELQAQYKGDRERLNAEMMAFYKENDISPLGGCLPILAQSPIFIVMYRLLSGLTTRIGGVGSGVGHVVSQVQQGVAPTSWVYNDQNFLPEHINDSSRLYHDLILTNKMKFLGLDLAMSPKNALAAGVVTFLPFAALLLAILGIQMYQNHQIQARNPAAQSNPQQQMLMKIMPFMLPAFAFTLSAAMAVYWGIQGLCRIAVQTYITRRFYHEHENDVVNPTTTGKKSSSGKPQAAGAKGSKQESGRTAAKKTPAKASISSTSKAAGTSKAAKAQSRKGRKSSATSSTRTSDTSAPSARRSGDPRNSVNNKRK